MYSYTCIIINNYMYTCIIIIIQWNPPIPDTLGTNICVLIKGVDLYYKAQFRTFIGVLNTGVSSIEVVIINNTVV